MAKDDFASGSSTTPCLALFRRVLVGGLEMAEPFNALRDIPGSCPEAGFEGASFVNCDGGALVKRLIFLCEIAS